MGELLGEEAPDLPTRPLGGLRDALVEPPSFEKGLRGLRSDSPAVQRSAVRSLARPGNARAVPYLGALLIRSDADARVRLAAAHALGRVGDWRGLEFLRQGSEDPDPNVRFAAALSLGKLRGNDAVALLEGSVMRDGHWWVRYAGAIALGEARNPAAVPALAKALDDDPQWQVRQQAARSLGEYRSRTAMDALGRGLRDSDPAVRYASARELGAFGGLDSVALLQDATELEREELPRARMGASIKQLVSAEEP